MLIKNRHCEVVACTDGMSHDDWLALRKMGMGGSEAAGCFNPPLSKYTSPMIIVMDKLGLLPPTPDNEHMKHGRRMEPVLRNEFPAMYLEATGKQVQVFETPYMYRSTEWPWMLANLDGCVQDEIYVHGLEIKTAGFDKEWLDDSVPDAYYCQVQHYMAVTGFAQFFFGVLIGKRYEYRIVPRNDEFIEALVAAEKEIWDCVQRKEIPAPSGIDNEESVINGTYSQDTGASIDAPDLEETAESLVDVKRKISALESEEKKLTLLLKERMGSAKYGKFGKHSATWPRYTVKRFNVSAFRDDHPDLCAQYEQDSPTGMFKIK